MAKPTGFIEYPREEAEEEAVSDRIQHFNEFKKPSPIEKQRTQAARCMDCGIPYCHQGLVINGKTTGCPLGNLIPEWNDLVYKGLWLDAMERLYKTNNFPEFTGRVCPAPCEGSCTVGINLPAVGIKNIEFAIAEKAYELGWIRPHIPDYRTEKKVAIIGSGPSGLACAEQLNLAGHWVHVYERSDRLGGLLTYGIPNMKLSKKIVEKRIEILKASGISFYTHTTVGEDITTDELLKQYDAIILCTGSTVPRDLSIPGRHFSGVHFAMDFLTANTKRQLGDPIPSWEALCAKDKHVVIVGGGDTGTDCIATAIRQGCRSVTQLEINPKPPRSRAKNNPWPQWPKILKTDYGQEEALETFGEDPRRFNTLTKELIGNQHQQVTHVETIEVEWVQESPLSRRPIEIMDSRKRLNADMVLIAIGFSGPEQSLIQQFGLATDGRSNILAKDPSYQTNQPKIFAAGDARRGQSLVVWAIQEGRQVAKSVDAYLKQEAHISQK